MAKQTPHKKEPNNDTQLWRMCWFLLVILTITLLVSIAMVMIMQDARPVSLSVSLLTVIGFIVRWLFPRNKTDRAVGENRHKSQQAQVMGRPEKSNIATRVSKSLPLVEDE